MFRNFSIDSVSPLGFILLALLATDLAFIFLFGLLGLGVVSDTGFALTYDRSYAEVFQYVKQYWILIALALLTLKRKALLYAACGVLFAYFLVDDYAELHENFGEQLADYLQIPAMWMLQPYDFGELIVFAVYGCVSIALLGIAYWRAGGLDRSIAIEVVCLLGLIAFFAVGVDVLHALSLPETISNCLGAIEDGGEMMAFSLLLWRLMSAATRDIDAEHALKADSSDSGISIFVRRLREIAGSP